MDRLSDYDYHLPESSIAQRPLVDRAASRLLVLHKAGGLIEHSTFRELGKFLKPGDLLVLNDTRVSAFRLFGAKSSGARVEVLALKDLGNGRYEALVRPGKRLKPGTCILFGPELSAVVEAEVGQGRKVVRFESAGNLAEALAAHASVPLPPYVHAQLKDPQRYQTVYARAPGSAAAPTAGLHFTPELLEQLTASGVKTAWITLDVGLDTFRPVQSEDPADHPIHGEVCEVPPETARSIRECHGRVIAVGTTSVRTLESFATGKRQMESGRKETRLFIRPGYEFKIVDGMFTNFHMPRTTMLLMISALAGRDAVMRAYHEALQTGYRFLSFGDSMLIV